MHGTLVEQTRMRAGIARRMTESKQQAPHFYVQTEVAIDGVQASSRYAGGVALRFARVRRYREDKAPTDADTIDAVRSLLSSPPA